MQALDELIESAAAEIAAAADLAALDAVRVTYLGKKGALTARLMPRSTTSPSTWWNIGVWV